MKIHSNTPRKAINKAFLKVKPNRSQIEAFKANLAKLIETINENESEEFHKNLVSTFMDDTYYKNNHFINTKGRNDLVIHTGNDAKSTVGVIIEAKKPTNKMEMLRKDKINTKAFQELLLYFLRERITLKNKEIKHLVATNIYEWFIFDAETFEKEFAQNKTLVKQFTDFEEGRLSGKTTDFFYKEIAEPAINNAKNEINFTFFDLREYEKPLHNGNKEDDKKLIALFKLLSPEHLLKLPFANDSNTLDKSFYAELLHIIGLNEKKEKNKKLIGRKPEGNRDNGSLIENTMNILKYEDCLRDIDRNAYGATQEEQLYHLALELTITWVNRVLFLKLLEGQLMKYHKGDTAYKFLNSDRIADYDALNKLFFQVLAIKEKERSDIVTKKFAKVPYLNSSLFEPNNLEHKTIRISNLEDEYAIPLLSSTVLKDNTGKRLKGEMNTLEYLFRFLDAFDFASEGSEEIQEDNKALINASVLGLIFEKINGYKDGSFFTPGFITMYMAKETIRRAVVQKFNDAKGWDCKEFDDLYDKVDDKKEANKIINSLKICDPAVGSGHFLVSALNEIIAIKSKLKVLRDREGKTLRDYTFEVINDELIITDDNGNFFEYHPKSKESQRIQETIFYEKQAVIENCLFGVDINPNSVKICRLRLWIELLKNAYYKEGTEELETLPNIDINIKSGNSLVSRFALDADLKKALRKSKWNIESYRLAVSTYRNAENKEEKAAMQKLIDDIKNDFETNIDTPFKKKIAKARGEVDNIISEINIKKQWGEKLTREFKTKLDKATKKLAQLEEQRDEIKNNKIYENAFEWRFEFPEVLNDEGDFIGFDIVIGNPPYIPVDEFDDNSKKYFKDNYEQIERKYESSVLFIIKGLNIIKSNKLLCYISPLTWQTGENYCEFRKKLIKDWGIIKIINLPFNIFIDAYVDTAIYLFTNSVYNEYQIFSFDKKQTISNLEIIVFKKIPVNLLLEPKYKIILNPLVFSVIKRLDPDKCKKLGDITISTQGLSPSRFPKIKEPIDKYSFPYLKSGNAYNYCLVIEETYYTSLKGLESLLPFYEGKEKLLIRRIINRQDRLSVGYTEERLVFKKDINPFIITDKEFLTKYVLAILASKFVSYLYVNLSAIALKDDFRQTTLSELREIPIPIVSTEIQNKLVNLSSKIIDIKRNDYSENTSNLESQIDQMVYELYGLTEEEIRIVEESVG